MVTKHDLQRFIRAEIHQDFFEELSILIPQTFQKAMSDSQQLRNVPPEHLRGYLRYMYVQEAMGGLVRWSPVIRETAPKGSFFVLLAIGRVRLTAVVLPWQKEVREAKYRSELKLLNETLACTQIDWINEVTQPADDHLINALVIAHAPPPSCANQAEPLAIALAVPHFNGKGFHMSCALEELIDGYAEDEHAGLKPIALVKLRDNMRRAEDTDTETQAKR